MEKDGWLWGMMQVYICVEIDGKKTKGKPMFNVVIDGFP